MPPLTRPLSSSLTIAPLWPTHKLFEPPWPTHKQTDRTTMPTHPLTTTTATGSDHLYLDRAFRSRHWSYRRCLSLSLSSLPSLLLSFSDLATVASALSFSLKSLSLSLSLSLSRSSVGFVELSFFFFLGLYIGIFIIMCLEAEKMWEMGRKHVF